MTQKYVEWLIALPYGEQKNPRKTSQMVPKIWSQISVKEDIVVALNLLGIS
jgi:hypothetical protein